MSSKYIGNSADLGQGIYTVQDVQEKIKTDSWPVKYNIDNSLRFDGTSSYLSRTPSSASNRKTWTWSGWVKRSAFSDFQFLMATPAGASSTQIFYGYSVDQLCFGSTSATYGQTTSRYRDTSAWYHIIYALDTTKGTQDEMLKLWVNGTQIFMTNSSNITQNQDFFFNVNGVSHRIGGRADGYYFKGYLANIHFIDGQALDPSNFGFTHSVTNKWVPKAYKGTYGTNGFHLEFKNTGTHTGVGGIGEDTSGNGNHWTVSNFTADDVVPDSPTNSFATWNSIDGKGTTTNLYTFSEGNTKVTHNTTGQWQGTTGTLGVKTGKWYYELQVVTAPTTTSQNYNFGFVIKNTTLSYYFYTSTELAATGPYGNTTRIYIGSNTSSSAPTYGALASNGGIYQVYLDLDNKTIQFGLNNTWYSSYSLAELSNYEFLPVISTYAYGTPYGVFVGNFGQDPTFANTKVPSKVYTDSNGYGKFYYEPPAGALALCEANINQPENTVSEYVVDETGNHMLTYNGGVGISKFSPYAPDGYSFYSTETSGVSFGSTSDFKFLHDGTTSYTISGWIYRTKDTGTTETIFDTCDNASAGIGIVCSVNSNDIIVVSITKGQQSVLVAELRTNDKIPLNQWIYFAFVHETGQPLKLYLNGVEASYASRSYAGGNSVSNSSRSLHIGTYFTSPLAFPGYISDFRIIQNVDAANYAVPTSPVSSTGTDFLLSANSKQFVDSSSNAYTSTLQGSPEISDWSPFTPKPDAGFRRVEDYGGGSSFYFDGTNNLKTIDNTDWNPEGQDFTVEGWYYLTQTGSGYFMWGTGGSDGNEDFAMRVNTNNTINAYLRNSAGTLSVLASTNTVVKNTWNHITLERHNNVIKIYLNGVAETNTFDATSWTGYNSETGMSVGAFGDYGNLYWNGYIADFRLVKGSAIYQGNFTPPTAKLTAVTNTKYLLQPWHTKPARSSVYEITDSYKNDETGKSLTYYNGTSVCNSSPYKNIYFGSFNFDGLDDYLGLPTLTAFGTNDWTIEFWFKETNDNSGSYHGLINLYTGTTSLRFQTALYSGTLHFYTYDGNWRNTGWAPTVNKWHHIAITREFSSTTLTFRVDGVQVYTNATVGGRDYTADWDVNKLAHHSVYTSCQITDLRIIKGAALYTADFTPPTEPLTQTNETVLLLQPGKTSTVNIAAKKPEKHFNTLLYSGTGQTQSITGLDFQPDLVWTKSRNNSGSSHFLSDSIRGGTQALMSNSTSNELYRANHIQSFDSNGFTLGADGTSNFSGDLMVAWCWKAGGAPSGDGVAMVDGSATTTSALKDAAGASITPTRISVNTKAGFSIIKFNSGSAGNQTLPHGLKNKPDMVFFKGLDSASGWYVYHNSLTDDSKYMYLHATFTESSLTQDSRIWGGRYFDNNVISYESNYTALQNENYIAYCWHSVPGYSAFGSYEGNQNANGPFIYTGFRPAFVLTKPIDFAENWAINDSARSPNNPVDLFLRPDEPVQEVSSAATMDFLSNGFKLRTTDTKTNVSSTIIYAAFAEQPFTRTNAR